MAAYLETYADALRYAGGEPCLGWPSVGARSRLALRSLLSQFDGLLFPGGADIEPWRYGEEPHPTVVNTDPDLDEAQFGLATLTMEEDFPTLAICRGLQVLAVAAGGKLYQDLCSQYETQIAHRFKEPKGHLAHSVRVEPGSRLARASGSEVFEVNSRHHQAAREGEPGGWVGPLKVVARSPDGVVEGLEHPERSFLLAVQWHPENLVETSSAARSLFQAFVAAARARCEARA